MFKRLAILIPTRNRGELACRSALSVLDSAAGLPVEVVISDNSTDANESARIDAFVADRPSHDMTLIRPETSLAMAEHWQWAMSQVRSASTATHFFILTDRMLFKDDELAKLVSIVKAYPDDLISFTYDRIDDYSRPITFLPLPRTGVLYRMGTEGLLRKSANMVFYSCLPRMLNSVAPRELLELIETRFDSVFGSAAPDYCFCYRSLGSIESMLYYDASVLVNYASDRSNGASFARGIMTRDSADFARRRLGTVANYNTPIPELKTVGNAVIHEYCSVREQLRSDKFPSVAQGPYLEHMAREVREYLDPIAVADAERVLGQHGWHATPGYALRLRKQKWLLQMLSLRRRKFETLAEAIRYATTKKPRTVPWMARIQRRYGKHIVRLP